MTQQDIHKMNDETFALYCDKYDDAVCEELRVALMQLIDEQVERNKSAT